MYLYFQSEKDMLIEDRVGFACTFLSDSNLTDYINHLTDTVYQTGDLSGIILTGISCSYTKIPDYQLCSTRLLWFLFFHSIVI